MSQLKRCCRCGQEKPLKDFNFKYKSLGVRQKACKVCTRMEVKKHYKANLPYYLEKAKRRNKMMRSLIKKYIWEYLTVHPCIDCGEKDIIVLEFDHVKDKTFTISSVGRDKKLLDIKKEIKKCEVRCANCHRRKTAEQFGWHKNIMPL